jgi:hypothetical protein
VYRSGYLNVGRDDVSPAGQLSNKYLARVLVRALKTHAHDNPERKKEAVHEITLLQNPKTMAAALATPDQKQWMDTITKEMKSLINKDIHEVK